MNLIFLLPTLIVIARYLLSSRTKESLSDCCA